MYTEKDTRGIVDDKRLAVGGSAGVGGAALVVAKLGTTEHGEGVDLGREGGIWVRYGRENGGSRSTSDLAGREGLGGGGGRGDHGVFSMSLSGDPRDGGEGGAQKGAF